MTRMPPFSRAAGFTLVEVLMAATLLAVMMTLLLGSLRIGARSWEGGERRVAAMSRMLASQNFLRAQLSATLGLREMARADAPPGESLVFQGDEQRLRYVGTLPPQVRGGLYVFELHVAERGDARDLKLAMRPMTGGAAGGDAEAIDDVTLVENLDTLRIAYFPPAMRGALAEWRHEWRDSALPALIRLEITPAGEAAWPPLIIALRVEGRE
jgi:general secretion pathway protein J